MKIRLIENTEEYLKFFSNILEKAAFEFFNNNKTSAV